MTWAWLAWIVAFIILEAMGFLKQGGMTLTFLIEQHIPKSFIAGFLAFAAWHFLIAPAAKR
jgi:hypothetical protein